MRHAVSLAMGSQDAGDGEAEQKQNAGAYASSETETEPNLDSEEQEAQGKHPNDVNVMRDEIDKRKIGAGIAMMYIVQTCFTMKMVGRVHPRKQEDERRR